MNPEFAAQLIQAANARANLGGSPNATGAAPVTAPQLGNLQNLAQLQFAEGATGAAVGGLAGEARRATNEQEANQSASERMAEIIRKRDEAIADLDDPKNYRKELNEVGGYNFYDGKGKKITVQQYARDRNERVSDILKDSTDPGDVDYVNQYKKLSEMQRALSGGKEEEQKFFKENPDYKELFQTELDEGNSRGKAFYNLVELLASSYGSRADGSVRGLSQGNIQNTDDKQNQFLWLKNGGYR